MTNKPELKIRAEVEFENEGHWMKLRHYHDGTWEILDGEGFPIVQGFCSDEDE